VPLSPESSHTACFFDYSTSQMEAIGSSAPVNIVQHHRRLESSSLLPKEPLNIGCHLLKANSEWKNLSTANNEETSLEQQCKILQSNQQCAVRPLKH